MTINEFIAWLEDLFSKADKDEWSFSNTEDYSRMRKLPQYIRIDSDLADQGILYCFPFNDLIIDGLFVNYPQGAPKSYNGSGEACDMASGPCSCGPGTYFQIGIIRSQKFVKQYKRGQSNTIQLNVEVEKLTL